MITMLDRRLEFKRPVKIPDGRGGWTETGEKETVTEVWGAVHSLRGSELARYRTLNSQVTTKITIRGNEAVSPDCFVYCGTDEYRVVAVIPPGSLDEYTEILATKKTDAGFYL